MYTWSYARDLLERVLATFVQGFIGAITLDALVGEDPISGLYAAGVAGLAGVLSLLKGLVATQVGSQQSASLVPSIGPRPTPRRPGHDSVGGVGL